MDFYVDIKMVIQCVNENKYIGISEIERCMWNIVIDNFECEVNFCVN